MNQGRTFVFFLFLSLISPFAFSAESPQTIYGADGRREFYQLDTEKLRTLARKSVALVSNNFIPHSKGRTKILKGQSFGSYVGLCEDEKFFHQPSVAFCSGVLIGSRYVLTAGHCFEEFTCESTYFVLDFLVHSQDQQKEIPVNVENIYGCAQLKQRVVTRGMDFAIVELDRPVRDRRAVPLLPDAQVSSNLITIGYPSGIPLKVAFGGHYRSQSKNRILASIDSLNGNSGSPVYNENLDLVGIHISGEEDYTFDRSRSCYMDRRCPESGCKGESILKTSSIIQHLNAALLTQL